MATNEPGTSPDNEDQGLASAQPFKVFSVALHDSLERNKAAVLGANTAIWKSIDASAATNSTAKDVMRTVARDSAEQSARYMQNVVIAGRAFAQAKSPTDFVGAQQAFLRSSSTVAASGVLKIGETLRQAALAASHRWVGLFRAGEGDKGEDVHGRAS